MTKKLFFMGFAVMALLATASLTMAQPGGGPGGGRGQGGGPGGPGGGMGMMGGPGGGMGMMGGPGGGMGMMGGSAMGVLFNEEARKELGITDDQVQKLRDAGRAMFENMPRPQEGQRPDPAQMQEQFRKMQDESRKNLQSVLSAEQVTKLDVMVFQRSGGLDGPMANTESLRALDLTDDQKAKIQEAQEKMISEMRPPEGFDFRNASEEDRRAQFEKMRENMQKIRSEFQATVKGVLTEAQIAKAGELMKNVPEYLQQGPGGRGGPGGRQGGGLDGWQPGTGPRGENPNREQRQDRGSRSGRQFPG